MYKKFQKLLVIALWFLCTLLENVNSLNCTSKSYLFWKIQTTQCKPYQTNCCEWIINQSCCTKEENVQTEQIKLVFCRVIITVILVGITIILFVFIIGWIYSCYSIIKQIQNGSDLDNTRQITHLTNIPTNPSIVQSIFSRYFNSSSTNENLNTNENFSISIINDNPPSYNSLFNKNPSIKLNNYNSTNNESNHSLAIENKSFRSLENAPPSYPGV